MMKIRRIEKRMIRRSALRAFLYNVVLEGILWILVLFAVSKRHLTAVLSYQFQLHLLLMLMLGIYGITAVVFVVGVLVEILGKETGNEKTE